MDGLSLQPHPELRMRNRISAHLLAVMDRSSPPAMTCARRPRPNW
ncbi:MAG: hypothetical protein OXR72_14035 [Gemmatimonadota bacterium]|nr:hypothetical protein [Gemmatimonadota bacterium]